MKKTVYLILTLLIGSAVNGNAQVTIGDSKSPETFSILELVSKPGNMGGLRLPQLSDDEKIVAFGADNAKLREPDKADKAQGLQIFNTTSHCVETWDGQEWIPVCAHAGRLAKSINNGVITWVRFMTYNLGADPTFSIREQLLFDSSMYNGDPENADKTTGETNHLQKKFKPVYGSLYQWGRKSDGHENVWSVNGQYNQLIDVDKWDNTESDKFIRPVNQIYDWLENDGYIASKGNHLDRWGDGTENTSSTVKGVNDPCPAGFRIPSQDEFDGIITEMTGISIVFLGTNKWVWVTKNENLPVEATGTDLAANEKPQTNGFLVYPPLRVSGNTVKTYSTTPAMFLPAAGFRHTSSGNVREKSDEGYGAYWSNRIHGQLSYSLNFYKTDITTGGNNRANGFSVRCIAE
jgi:uncharacterized protein (TIGR02145 family)